MNNNIIKFKSACSIKNKFMSVRFEDKNGESFRYYPKWKDVRNIYGQSFARECLLYGVDTIEVQLFKKQMKKLLNKIEDYEKKIYIKKTIIIKGEK